MSILAHLSLIRLIALVLPALLSACAAPDRPGPVSEDVQATLARLAAKHQVCAVTVAVIKDRQLGTIASAAGCLEAAKPGPDSIFQAASLSKPVFAYQVLKLVEQGQLALDAPVVSYLPQGYRHRFHPFAATPPFKTDLVSDPRIQAVTVRMVLNHTSGLPNWASGPLAFDAAPGAQWQYSGEGYLLLQHAVEAVTGERLDSFMTARVFKPQGMEHSDYVWNSRFGKDIVRGSKANGAPRASWNLTSPIAPVTLYTSAADYAKFLVAMLNDERLLRQITDAPVTVDPGLNLSWGLGWGIERSGDDLFIWQWGNNPGYRAFVIASVRTGNGLVMLTNSENGLKLAQPMTQKVLPGEHKVFQSPMLGDDIINMVCLRLRLCF